MNASNSTGVSFTDNTPQPQIYSIHGLCDKDFHFVRGIINELDNDPIPTEFSRLEDLEVKEGNALIKKHCAVLIREQL